MNLFRLLFFKIISSSVFVLLSGEQKINFFFLFFPVFGRSAI